MEASLGRIHAALAEAEEARVTKNLVELINTNVAPPDPVKADDVFIRAMFIASDEVNSFGGRFPDEELQQLARLLVDSPVMIGHRKDKLPIGRNFHAMVIHRNDRVWVKSYFYWLKNADGAETLRENIDGGIYKECSIGFTFLFPECSMCGKDIRTCEHEPFGKYDTVSSENDEAVQCYFNYRKIERVLETSLVYRGAVPDTGVSKDLKVGRAQKGKATGAVVAIDDLAQLDADHDYLAVPSYESIPVTLSVRDRVLDLRRAGGEKLSAASSKLFELRDNLPDLSALGQLIGYKGKERCSLSQLDRHLNGRSSSVTRLEIKLFPNADLNSESITAEHSHHRIGVIPHRIGNPVDLGAEVSRLVTRDGVRLYRWDGKVDLTRGYHFKSCPQEATSGSSYHLVMDNSSAVACFTFEDTDCDRSIAIRQFNLSRFLRGSRFVADFVEGENDRPTGGSGHRGTVEIESGSGEGKRMKLSGGLQGLFYLRPIKLDGRKRYLFYKVSLAQ